MALAASEVPSSECPWVSIHPGPPHADDEYELEDLLEPDERAQFEFLKGSMGTWERPYWWPTEVTNASPNKDQLLLQSDRGDGVEVYFSMTPRKKKPNRDVNVNRLPPEQQKPFHAARQKEVKTVVSENKALETLSLEESEWIRKLHPDRIMGSRLRNDIKEEEDGIRAKCRLSLLGHLDPDLMRPAAEKQIQTSTVHVNSLNFTFQIIASLLADVELGDVTGAFTLSDFEKRKEGGLYAALPGGIDGVAKGN